MSLPLQAQGRWRVRFFHNGMIPVNAVHLWLGRKGLMENKLALFERAN
jgi:hypothetical protein